MIAANAAFAALPASIRARFNNDAGAYVDFFNDSKNYDEAVKLGLVEPRQESSTKANQIKPVGDDSSAHGGERITPSKKGVKSGSKADEGDA